MRQLTLPGMGEAFGLPLLSKPRYTEGKKLIFKGRWYLKIVSPVYTPRNKIIAILGENLKRSSKVSYSHTYIESMADIIILMGKHKEPVIFYNSIQRKLYVSVGMDTDFAKLYEVIEGSM
jgi:hypothetical protein